MNHEARSIRTFDSAVGAIRVRDGETFALLLDASGAVGYEWRAAIDSRYLVLEAHYFQTEDKAPGAAGRERLVFRAVRAGRCDLALVYGRAWDNETRDRKDLIVDIESLHKEMNT
jgi:predicted secreted protein